MTEPYNPQRILNLSDVASIASLSRMTIYAHIRLGYLKPDFETKNGCAAFRGTTIANYLIGAEDAKVPSDHAQLSQSTSTKS